MTLEEEFRHGICYPEMLEIGPNGKIAKGTTVPRVQFGLSKQLILVVSQVPELKIQDIGQTWLQNLDQDSTYLYLYKTSAAKY